MVGRICIASLGLNPIGYSPTQTQRVLTPMYSILFFSSVIYNFCLNPQVPQKYNIFEELYHKLDQKFASVVFPPLPKKTLLVSDAVVSERRRFMETVLQQIAKTPKLACSSLVLEFLGATRAMQKELDPLEKVSESFK